MPIILAMPVTLMAGIIAYSDIMTIPTKLRSIGLNTTITIFLKKVTGIIVIIANLPIQMLIIPMNRRVLRRKIVICSRPKGQEEFSILPNSITPGITVMMVKIKEQGRI